MQILAQDTAGLIDKKVVRSIVQSKANDENTRKIEMGLSTMKMTDSPYSVPSKEELYAMTEIELSDHVL
jgi:hypothetical protein